MIKIKRRKMIVFTLVMSLVCFLGAIGGSIGAIGWLAGSPSISNTTEIEATVRRTEIKYPKKNRYGVIYTEEYGDELEFFYFDNLIAMSDFNSLQAGQTIFFRIENTWLDHLGTTDFVYIVSLRTTEKEMFSIDDFNQYMEQFASIVWLIAIIGGPILLLLSVHCFLLLKGINIFHMLKGRN